ncbi:Ca2+:H+ antiporter, variant [Microbotryum lychnidis-dioicae p1A1 Lamole]|uniref:Vacuolar calcium ion transporter n=1 Tax=Microbotryum lychnidis-dioicae (strain p1A1 Lamole / MvSl-1064) TaxID=683840 RepID=U5HDQ1_USTV1|nr:Ca2+:H+ antiporter, variant [Microbotryum lychnidis-dioicae p1A1 Lamole]|eukprot:KDE04304.1 Ca2+:H+ antiporter, variant [Microbotryum lychnidis-dioicae p1A1 Lamole]
MAPSNNNSGERDALLGNNNNRQHTYHDDLGNGAQGDIGVVASLKALLFSGWLNILLVAVPLSFISHFARWGATADFIISFIAIIPLASLLGDATEQCALKLGQTLGGLMNATFGNAVEAIVGILALTKGELRIVQTSMLGSILSNILLVLGCSFLAAGYKFKESNFQVTAAQASSSLMVLGTTTLVIPAAYHVSRKEANGDSFTTLLTAVGDKTKDFDGLLTISRGTAIILLVCYAFYLLFQLKTHAYLFEDPQDHEEEEAKMNVTTAVASLCIVTVITSFCADYLVGAIDEFADQYKIPKSFIGLILIPIVGNAAEHVTSVWMAMKGKMEITIGVAIGSSIQIAVGVIPLLVVVGWAIGQNLTLYFETFETIILFISIYLVNCLVQDGKSNWLEGMMLVALYAIIALSFWVS